MQRMNSSDSGLLTSPYFLFLCLGRLGAKRNRCILPSSTQLQASSRLETILNFVVVGANLHRPS